jgi:hypothetical protein
MDKAIIFQFIEGYIKKAKPDTDVSNLEHVPVESVLTSSIDVIEFVMHLEDVLELEEEIDLETLGPKFAQKITFAKLADEMVVYLEAQS